MAIPGSAPAFKHIIYVYLMVSVYNECVICDCDGAEILRPQHFVISQLPNLCMGIRTIDLLAATH